MTMAGWCLSWPVLVALKRFQLKPSRMSFLTHDYLTLIELAYPPLPLFPPPPAPDPAPPLPLAPLLPLQLVAFCLPAALQAWLNV